MKSILKSIVVGSTLSLAGHASAATVSLDFTTASAVSGSPTVFSTTGDIWRSNNVRVGALPGQQMDAIFTITNASGVTAANLAMSATGAPNENMRVRMNSITNAAVFITIRLVNAGTNTNYSHFTIGDTLSTQFSDLDSDVGQNRSDFAGARTSEWIDALTADDVTPGTSLLDLVINPAVSNDYTLGIMKNPWGPQGDVVSTDPVVQSPVTVGFLYAPRTTFDIVVGQRAGSGVTPSNRTVQIDMTPDFNIVPEPSSALLGGLGMLALLRRRR